MINVVCIYHQIRNKVKVEIRMIKSQKFNDRNNNKLEIEYKVLCTGTISIYFESCSLSTTFTLHQCNLQKSDS